ncbi:heavy metal translocating P-type ATPase [Magnetococcales bacterium HHB-1]
MISLGGMSLSIASFALPQLRLPALAVSLLGSSTIFRLSAQELKKGKIDGYVFAAIVNSASVFMLKPFFVSFYSTVQYCSVVTEEKALDKAKNTLSDLFGGQLTTAWIKKGDTLLEVGIDQLSSGDQIICQAGDTIPVDGVVQSGTAMVDQHILFGEQYPVAKGMQDAVYAGTVVISGEITMTLIQSGVKSMAAQVNQLLTRTADYRSRTELTAQKERSRAIAVAFGLSALAVPVMGISSALGVLISAPGIVFIYAAPFSTLSTLTVSSQNSIVIKDGRALEALHNVDVVLFDKTGTLTLETPQVGQIRALKPFKTEEILRLAAIAEGHQSHPIAQALCHYVKTEKIGSEEVACKTGVQIGKGVEAVIQSKKVAVGNRRLMQHIGLEIPESLISIDLQWSQNGSTTIFVAVNQQIAGAIELKHTLRSGARQCIEALQSRGITCEIVSGDSYETTAHVASQLNIQSFHAGCLPNQKVNIVTAHQKAGRRVCFVGDGINDTVALKSADISISLSSASHAAVDTAAVILLSSRLDQIEQLLTLVDRYHQANRWGRMIAYAVPSMTMASTFFLKTPPLLALVAQEIAFWGAMGAAILIPQYGHTTTAEEKTTDSSNQQQPP